MFEYKLQIACLILVAYIIGVYIKSSSKTLKCHPIFDILLIVTPWAIGFDGLTAWTVNHMEIVPWWLNNAAHAIFLVLMSSLTGLMFVYIIDQAVGVPRNRRYLLLIPSAIVSCVIVATMGSIYYVQGKTTWYSFGTPVFLAFVSLLVHFIVIIISLVFHRRTIEKRKVFSLGLCMLVVFIILLIQFFFTEALYTSLLSTFIVICFYMNFEDPALRRIGEFNLEMVTSFATLVENRDGSTGGHIKRTRDYAAIILDDLWKVPRYKQAITKDYVMSVLYAAPLHDIGKISTPDDILKKPGKLTDEEYEIMKQHSSIGGEIILETFSNIGAPDFEKIAYEVARHHHEKWNGKGYPDGLAGEEIPLHARIMAIADVFDAVSAKRCYRAAMPIEKCFKIIEEGSGTDFDPVLVQLFLDAKDRVLDVYEKAKQKDEDLQHEHAEENA